MNTRAPHDFRAGRAHRTAGSRYAYVYGEPAGLYGARSSSRRGCRARRPHMETGPPAPPRMCAGAGARGGRRRWGGAWSPGSYAMPRRRRNTRWRPAGLVGSFGVSESQRIGEWVFSLSDEDTRELDRPSSGRPCRVTPRPAVCLGRRLEPSRLE